MTINKKELEQVMEELASEFPREEWKIHDVSKEYYLPYSSVEKRLNSVVGRENYDFLLGEPQVVRVEDKWAVMVKGTITLYLDDGRAIQKSGLGGSFVIVTADKKVTSLANAADSAAKDVFKRCAKMFGVGEKRIRREGNSNSEGVKFDKLPITSAFIALPKGGAKAKTEKGELIIWKKDWEMLKSKYPEQFYIGGKVTSMTFFGIQKSYKGAPQIQFLRF